MESPPEGNRLIAGGRAPRVLVVGSANIDYVVSAPRLSAPGETVTGGTLRISHGGKGANQAVAARRLGAEVRFIGCVGDDPAGAAIRARLAAEGIGDRSLTDALRFATAAGALACTRRGAQDALPARADVEALVVSQEG